MLITIPFAVWGQLIYLKGSISKTATQEEYEAFKKMYRNQRAHI
jgi:hypothetical protein